VKIQNPKSKIQNKTECQNPKAPGAMRAALGFRTSDFLWILNFGFWISLAGCRPPANKPIYTGPTQSMSAVVNAVNANATGVTSIWSDHTFRAWIHDDHGKQHYVDGDGVLLFRKTPDRSDELLIQGKSIIGKIFEIGSSSGPEAQYWVAVVPEVATEWWGYYKNLGKPCARPIPIRPDLVMEVLGVNDIETNFLQPPVPAMRFNNDEKVYMLTFNFPLADRWVVQKEVWYDLETKLPTKVLIFDANGRVQLRANLLKHEALEGSDKKIATRYELFFPETRDKLEFHLISPKLSRRGIPREGTIQRRPISGDVREVQIDEGCP
jgi:hypothetical protein